MLPTRDPHRRTRREDLSSHELDRELVRQLHVRQDLLRRAASLRAVTGVRDQKVLTELAENEFDDQTVGALTVYPAVRIAWADGRVDRSERREILETATFLGCPPRTPGRAVVQRWLDEKPSDRLHAAWQKYTQAVCESLGESVRPVLKSTCLIAARRVATASGAVPGSDGISGPEAEALAELLSAFEEVQPDPELS